MAEAPSDVESSRFTCYVLGHAAGLGPLSATCNIGVVPLHLNFPIPIAVQCCLQPRTSNSKYYSWK